jgi:NB-ARC domain/TIR domain
MISTGPRVFLSYAHADGTTLARRLSADLAEAGFSVWFDVNRLFGESGWSAEIESNVDCSDVAVVLLSRGAERSGICRGEQFRAFRQGKMIVPVLVQEDAGRPLFLESHHCMQFHDDSGYAEGLHALINALAGGWMAKWAARYRSTYVTAPQLPPNFIPRPAELEALRQMVRSDASGRRVALTAVRGMGGIGKTVLAQALCHDHWVQDKFRDGVLWATIGRNPTELHLIQQMREIARELGGDLSLYDTISSCADQFRRWLAAKNALLVLDDVWDWRHVTPFLPDSEWSRVVLTTSDRAVVEATGAREFSLDVLEPRQARELVALWSGTSADELPAETDAILAECCRLPLALAMIGAFLHGKGRETWRTVLGWLREADLENIRMLFPDYPNHACTRSSGL